MSPPPAQRVVAIVGRPNVGKSALFNRLAGRRIAIVHEEPGVTRDRLQCEVLWDRQRFDLVDTGGLTAPARAAAQNDIEKAIHQQADAALEDAAAVILTTDLTAGVTPLDQDIAQRLHRGGRFTVVAANKADTEALDAQAADFSSLGFPVFPVSALHNRGLGPLMNAVLTALPPDADLANSAPPLKVAVVGRPNVGKSSYINSLLGSDRVIVSDQPGTTRDSVDVPFGLALDGGQQRYVLIDTAGARRLSKTHTAVERYSLLRAQKSIRRADVVALMLDATEGPGDQDKKLAAQILEAHKGCLVLVNKWDLAESVKRKDYEEALRREMPFLDFAPIVFLSARTGYSLRRSIEVMDQIAAQTRTTLTTGVLNRVLQDLAARVQPPQMTGRRRLKIYYATQTGIQPVRLRLFVNDPRLLADAYRAYLARGFRQRFGLEGAPLVLEIRASHDEAREKDE